MNRPLTYLFGPEDVLVRFSAPLFWFGAWHDPVVSASRAPDGFRISLVLPDV